MFFLFFLLISLFLQHLVEISLPNFLQLFIFLSNSLLILLALILFGLFKLSESLLIPLSMLFELVFAYRFVFFGVVVEGSLELHLLFFC